jgi:TM2 domain-containing membrane protein YozV
MFNKLTSTLSLLGILLFATSCSTYDRVAVWYKYRNDFRVHKVNQDRLASTARTVAPVAATAATPSTPIAVASADVAVDNVIPTTASQAKALASAIKAGKASTGALSISSAKGERVTLHQALKMKKMMKQSAKAPAAGKSQLIALILVVLVGGLGIHRFYLGYVWQGVVQLLTAGGCGIWWIIDLIRIVTGDLGPKGGEYAETL